MIKAEPLETVVGWTHHRFGFSFFFFAVVDLSHSPPTEPCHPNNSRTHDIWLAFLVDWSRKTYTHFVVIQWPSCD